MNFNTDGESLEDELLMEQMQENAKTQSENKTDDLLQGQGQESTLDDFNYVDGREIYTPALPQAKTMKETRYSPPLSPKDTEEVSPRRLPPMMNSQQQQQSLDKSEHDQENIKMALPPISGSGNKVAPADEEMMYRSELRQRATGSYDPSRSQGITAGQRSGKVEKEELIIGGKLLLLKLYFAACMHVFIFAYYISHDKHSYREGTFFST